jgi:hypothetical protein
MICPFSIRSNCLRIVEARVIDVSLDAINLKKESAEALPQIKSGPLNFSTSWRLLTFSTSLSINITTTQNNHGCN